MGLLLALLLALGVMNAQPPVSASIQQDNTALRSGCADDAPVMQQLAAGAPIKLRFALSGEKVPCYKVAVEVGGRQIEGYLPATAIAGLDSFDKGRKQAAWVSVNEALNAARNAASLEALKAPEGAR